MEIEFVGYDVHTASARTANHPDRWRRSPSLRTRSAGASGRCQLLVRRVHIRLKTSRPLGPRTPSQRSMPGRAQLLPVPSLLSHLECSRCSTTYSADELQQRCDCGGALMARYDLQGLSLGEVERGPEVRGATGSSCLSGATQCRWARRRLLCCSAPACPRVGGRRCG